MTIAGRFDIGVQVDAVVAELSVPRRFDPPSPSAPAVRDWQAAIADPEAISAEDSVPTVEQFAEMSPREVAASFDELTPSEVTELVETHPEVIGGLDGAPPNARYRANNLLIATEVEQLNEEATDNDLYWATSEADIPSSTGSGSEQFDVDGFEAAGNRRRDIDGRVETLTGMLDDDRQILLFDPNGDGRVAEVFGDLEAAEHIAVVVPGAGTDIDNLSRLNADAENLYRASDGEVATIAWLGYDAPSGIPGASLTGSARDGADRLISFMDGVDAIDGDGHLTVVAHSYGSVLTGYALQDRLAADEVIFVGSPGVPLEYASDANLLPGGRIWAGAARWDHITVLPSTNTVPEYGSFREHLSNFWVARELFHGSNPVHDSFGATEFTTDGATGHSQYFESGTKSLDNIVAIARGLTPEDPGAPVAEVFPDEREVAPGPFGEGIAPGTLGEPGVEV